MDSIGTSDGFCSQTAGIWQLAGYCMTIFKIVIPAILIIIGIIILGKAVISSDDKEMKKGFRELLTKFIIAVCIFFIPSIVSTLFGVVGSFDDVKEDFKVCEICISHPNGENCASRVLAMQQKDLED